MLKSERCARAAKEFFKAMDAVKEAERLLAEGGMTFGGRVTELREKTRALGSETTELGLLAYDEEQEGAQAPADVLAADRVERDR
jgi:hypothetical protein